MAKKDSTASEFLALAMRELGRRRQATLTKEQKVALAKKAARQRWKNYRKQQEARLRDAS